jgi:hypothetical protein
MVDKIHSRRGSQSHLPSRRQRSKLRDGLRLQCSALPARSHHAYHRLTSRVDPRRCASVVVDIVWPSFRGISLLPPSRQTPRSSGRSIASCSDSGGPASASGGGSTVRGRGGLPVYAVGVGVVGFKKVVSEDTTSVLIPRSIRFALLCGVVYTSVRRRPVPSGTAGVVVDIVRPAKRVDATFPARREGTVLVDIGVEVAHLCSIGGVHGAGIGGYAR